MMTKGSRSRYGYRNDLALRFASAAGLIVGLLVVVAWYVSGTLSILIWLPGVIIVSALVSYAAVHMLLVRKIEMARTTLRQFRKRNFTNLPKGKLPRGDVLDELVRQVYRAGNVMQGEIRRLKKMESYRREFLGDVSHELRTPIFAIQGFAETLLDGALDDDAVNRVFLGKIINHAGRLNALVEDLSYISLIETGEMEMRTSVFSLNELVTDVMDAFSTQIEKNVLRLNIIAPADLQHVVGDRERIHQVLSNLVENAIKYSDEGGDLQITLRSEDESIGLDVTDTGIGIPKKDLPRVTERFYRVDKSRSREKGGTGLGLAIAKHILEAHGQRLRIKSEPGRGSTFTFRLPKALLSS